MSRATRPIEVLLVEDNPGDAYLISEMLREVGLVLNITIARDGQRALDIMGEGTDRPNGSPPDFVILDLNIPKVKGFDVLAFMKANPNLRSIPVVVMTGSLNPQDEVRAREMGVADYRIKASAKEEFDETGRWLRKYLAPLAKTERAPDRATETHEATLSPDRFRNHDLPKNPSVWAPFENRGPKHQ